MPAPTGTAAEPARVQRTESLPSSFVGGRYVVRAFLGEGAKKRVYLAHDTRLDRDVAFALIKTEGLDAEGVARIRREARAMGRLGDHPHIVTVFDAGEDHETTYIVSQHMSGGSVEDALATSENRRLPAERAMRIAAQITEALAHAHARSIVHRDLKPGNVWLDADGNAALGDFGLAVAIDRSRITMQGMMVGTVAYMAPEQALGRAPDARSDLYSLGAMLYEMVAGRPPFLGDDAVGVISQHINTAPVAPTWHEPAVPGPLETLILRLLAKSPDERPALAADVARELRRILARSTVTEHPGADADPIADLRQLDWGRFVGRRDEMTQLKAGLEQAFSGKLALAFVAGEPGIGKTRLAEEFAVYAELRGAQVLTGRSYEGESTVPYRPFVEALRQYARAQPDAELRQQLGPGAPEIATMISDVRERFPDIHEAPKLEGDAERLRLFDSVATFLRNASVIRPLVLLFDDLHWVDRPSLLLLQHIARHCEHERLLLVATYRDVDVDRTHPLAEALPEFRRIERFARIALRGLVQDEVYDLLTSIEAGDDTVDMRQTLAAAIWRETEGNPFFIREVLQHLVESGKLQREHGRWSAGDRAIDDLGIPEGVREVIGRRLSRLSGPANVALTRASAMTRGFTWDQFRAINSSAAEADLLDVVDEALRAQLVMERKGETPVVYDFTHALIRQTLYEELSTPRRVLLHREIGEALEQLYGRDIDAHVGELAYHFFEAAAGGDSAKALDYCTRAGDRAMNLHGYEEAMRHFERANQALGGIPSSENVRGALLERLAHACWHAGDFERARTSFGEAADVASAMGDAGLLARAALGYAGGESASFAAGQVDEQQTALLTAALDALPSGDSPERALVMARLAHALTFSPVDRWRHNALAGESVAMARRLAEPRVLARVLNFWHFSMGSPDNVPERIAVADEIVQLCGESDPVLLLQGIAWGAVDRLEVGELRPAQAAMERYEALQSRLRSTYYEWFGLIFQCLVSLLSGHYAEAEALCQRTVRAGQGAGNENAPQIFGAQLAAIRYSQKRLAELEPLVHVAIAQNPRVAAWRAALAMIYAETGRTAEARTIVAELTQRDCQLVQRDIFFLITIAVLALAVIGSDDAEHAAMLYNVGTRYAGRFPHILGVCLGSWDAFLGQLAALAGRTRDALAHFEKGLAENIRIAGPEAFYAHLSTAKFALTLVRRDEPGDRERAIEMLNDTIALAQRSDWPRVVEECVAAKLQIQGVTEQLASIDHVAEAVRSERPTLWHDAVAPDGTVTIMFSDIEDSTVLTERLGDQRWQELLRQHDAMIRSCVEGHAGFVVKHLGDGFMLAFQSAGKALACAIAVQQAFAQEGALPEPVRVRIGMHAGEAVRENDDFFGKNVVMASRVAGQARGGEILVSSVLRALVESSVDAAMFREPREVALKGLDGMHAVYPIDWLARA